MHGATIDGLSGQHPQGDTVLAQRFRDTLGSLGNLVAPGVRDE
jgi:hypothetical protein